MTTIDHTCVRVFDLERSISFYKTALGLEIDRTIEIPARNWKITFMTDGKTDFQLELCQVLDRTEPYHLGDDTPHVALRAQDFDALKAKHREMGLLFDELDSGIYFIKDPDGHILEILPPKQ